MPRLSSKQGKKVRRTQDDQLIIFVKAPRPGQVKTRLARALGAERACQAYCRLAAALFSNLSDLSPLELRFTPDDAGEHVRAWQREGWTAQPQGAGDLGDRLARAFREAFAKGAKRVAIIGSDCPAVSQSDIRTAFALLASHDVVIGPARDGGYWLIGLREERSILFRNMPWSTSCVLQRTIERAADAKLRTAQLRELSDVDTESDWNDFLAQNSTTAATQ